MTGLSDAEHGEQVRARLAAATPGPWEAWEDGDGFTFVNGPNQSATRPLLETLPRNLLRREDAELIANAPADLARLLDRAEAAEERIARCRAQLAYLGTSGSAALAALDGNQATARIDETSLG